VVAGGGDCQTGGEAVTSEEKAAAEHQRRSEAAKALGDVNTEKGRRRRAAQSAAQEVSGD